MDYPRNRSLYEMKNETENKRIAYNSLFLLLRMVLLTLVSLYTSRVVLHSLGASDYGLYNVVGGIVVMFVFLNNSMMNATQRYLTFELGKNNIEKLNKIFCVSINIHILIAFVVFLLTETVGLWFLYNKLVVPEGRLEAAFWTLQFSAVATIFTIVSVPYNALIIAHEKMSAFAYISIFDAAFKLLVAFLISITSFDRLILYSFLLFVISVIDRIIYNVYCTQHFPESKYKYIKDNALFKEMLGFAGWSLIGNLAYVGGTEGLNIMLNMFFNPVVNAARAIAVQIQGVMINFSSNVENAIKPQITKSYALENKERLFALAYASGRFTFFALLLVSFPVLFEADTILKIWLHDVPEHTANFVRLILVCTLVDVLSNPMLTLAQASLKIRRYQTIVGFVYLLVVPFAYIALTYWKVPEIVFWVNLLIFVVLQVIKIMLVCPMVNMPKLVYVRKVYLKSFLVVLFSGFITSFPFLYIESSILKLVLVVTTATISILFGIYVLGVDARERQLIYQKVLSLMKR